MRPEPGQPQVPQPLISVSVVSHGDGPELRILLESLTRYESAGSLQLLVTDNLAQDVADVAPGHWHSVIMLRPSRPRGFAANHNAAFRHAIAPYFCVLNPDVIFEKGLLLRLIRRLEEAQGDIVAPLLLDAQGRVLDSFRGLPSPWEIVRRRIGRVGLHPAPTEGALLRPDWIAGTFMLLRSETFSRLGGFDARYRLYFEDVDLCTRARLLGLTILVDSGTHLRHDPRRASRRAGRHFLWHVQSAIRFFASDVYRRARQLRTHA